MAQRAILACLEAALFPNASTVPSTSGGRAGGTAERELAMERNWRREQNQAIRHNGVAMDGQANKVDTLLGVRRHVGTLSK